MNKKLLLVPLLFAAQSALAQQSPMLYMELKNQPVGEVFSPDQQNLQSSQSVSLMCVFNMTSHVGTPKVDYIVQGKVPTTESGSDGVYFNLLQSIQASEDNVPVVLIMGPGVENAPKLNKALPVPKIWRITIRVTLKNEPIAEPAPELARNPNARTVNPLVAPGGDATATGNLSCRVQ